jgi:hypothetical protein
MPVNSSSTTFLFSGVVLTKVWAFVKAQTPVINAIENNDLFMSEFFDY